ncbi:MAG: phosphate acyltransferase PlsX [Acidimicrobiia bacterium]
MARIALDAMGGDRAPEELVAGAILAAREGVDVVLIGDEGKLQALLDADGADLPTINATEVIGMDDDPGSAIREKKDASVAVAARLVEAGEAVGMVSAGSTGATLAAAALIIGRLPGVSRPAIGSLFPAGDGIVVLDVGANIECHAEHLAQFAVMGSALATTYLAKTEPRVGLLNIGEEEGKGRALEKEAHALLSKLPVNFIGNVEGYDLATDKADVFVTDGFTGNVMLKTSEGAARFLAHVTTEALLDEADPELAHALAGRLAGINERIDPESYGGAHLVGTKGVVVIAHGSSSRIAVTNALRMAAEGAARDLPGRVAAGLAG